MRETVLERVGRRFMADRTRENLLICAELLDRSPDEESAELLSRGMREAVEGAALGLVPEELSIAVGELRTRFPGNKELVGFAVWMTGEQAGADLRRLVADSTQEETERIAFLKTLAGRKDRALLAVLFAMVESDQESKAIKLAAINALARYDGDSVPDRLLARYSKMSPDEQKTAQSVLVTRIPWSRQLLQAVDEGRIARESISYDALLLIQSRGDDGVEHTYQATVG